MTLFNSQNPRIAAAQAQLIETLAATPDEYGAADVVDDYQAELTAAVAANHDAVRAELVREKAKLLNRPGRKGRKRMAPVVDLAERRVA